jgi:hypothetical protein
VACDAAETAGLEATNATGVQQPNCIHRLSRIHQIHQIR